MEMIARAILSAMLEARTFVTSLEPAREKLASLNAEFKGEYEIHNDIYSLKDKSRGIGEVFLRLRTIPKNIWNEKWVVVAIKETELRSVGKNSIIPLKKQFDTKEEAQVFVDENYADQFEFCFESHCIGWQYDLGEDQVDLEDIEGHYSIEFKSKTEEGLQRLLDMFNIKETIKGPSVVGVKELLGR